MSGKPVVTEKGRRNKSLSFELWGNAMGFVAEVKVFIGRPYGLNRDILEEIESEYLRDAHDIIIRRLSAQLKGSQNPLT